MTEIQENLKRIWDCLVTKAPEITSLLQPGLKPEEIDEITKDLPFKLPEEVYEIYQWVSYCREIWCVIPFDKTVIVCEKPQIRWRDNFFTKFIQKPDLTFLDGYRL
ncbi:MAG: hypothetical protein RMY28_032630 [Nostoc sp. ChiSLP01]|nr:hypothetical protein [Nostoc sp. CmiSLP01]MDZ8284216.1 hypothetical protein [Nostoc sp. ChiSLP01]